MKKVLILSFYSLLNDQRILRQINWLKDDYQVTTVSAGPLVIAGVLNHIIKFRQRNVIEKVKRGVFYKLGFFEKIYWESFDFRTLLNDMGNDHFDLVIANDFETLPLAVSLARSGKILFDAHEYAPAYFDNSFYWRFFFKSFANYVCRKYIPRCHAMTTVTSGLATLYQQEFNIKPIVITNAADYVSLEPLAVDKENIRIITHGNAHPMRRIELMIESMGFVDERFHLDLMLMPTNRKYHAELARQALHYPNVRMIDPIPSSRIITHSHSYDLAFLVFQPQTMNYKFGLGNKYFECIQARLGIITGPYPIPQAELTGKYHCGIVVPEYSPQSIGRIITKLTTEEIANFKMNAHLAAREISSGQNSEIFLNIVANLLSN